MVDKAELRPKKTTEKKKESKEEGDQIKAFKNKLKKRDAQIRLLKKKVENYKEQYLRKMADMENLRKRLDREKTEFYQYALSEFLKELFTVLDNFERAILSQNQSDGRSFREGIEMIYRHYKDLLIKQGVTPIEIKEKQFDPRFHQAFITVESEEIEEPEIIEELQKGYILHNRLLRPALVKVAVPKKGK